MCRRKMSEVVHFTSEWRVLSAGYERGRLLSWFVAIRFTFTKITISKINGTRYAIAQPIIPIPDIIIGNPFLRPLSRSLYFLTSRRPWVLFDALLDAQECRLLCCRAMSEMTIGRRAVAHRG